jgi:hypothetical protein
MIPKSGKQLSEKIMLQPSSSTVFRFDSIGFMV